jgi:hypothetical protein
MLERKLVAMGRKRRVGSVVVAVALVAACGGAGSDADSGPDGGSGVVPRLVAPLSTTMVRELRPTLRWTGGEGDTFTLEVSPSRDFDDIEYSWTGTAFEHAAQADLAPGPWFWRVSTPGPDGEPLVSHLWLVFAGALEHDLNADGYSDIVVGAGTNYRAYVFTGREEWPAELSTEDAAMIVSYHFSYGGACTSSDMNGDGISDLTWGTGFAVGSVHFCYGREHLPPEIDGSDECRVFLGTTEGLSIGGALSTRGDVDLDGHRDLVVSAWNEISTDITGGAMLFASQGKPVATAQSSDDAVWSLRGTEKYDWARPEDLLADFNGDGFSDILVSFQKNETTMRLFFGSPDLAGEAMPEDADVSFPPFESWGRYHFGVFAGDVDGDGYGDAIVSYTWSGVVSYFIRVVAGGPQGDRNIGPDDFLTSIELPVTPLYKYGHIRLFAPGDVNGDGYADIGFCVRGGDEILDGPGAIYIVYGGPEMPAELTADQADVVIQGNGDPQFCKMAAGLGDVNGDGYPDFAVGAPGLGLGSDWDGDFPGRVFVFFGGPTLAQKETADDADVVITSATPDELFGRCINSGR